MLDFYLNQSIRHESDACVFDLIHFINYKIITNFNILRWEVNVLMDLVPLYCI